MTEVLLPSDSFWEKIGFDVKRILGTRRGPRQQHGLTGWTSDEYRSVTNLTKEIRIPQDVPRKAIPGLILRNAPQAAKLLTLLGRYASEVPQSALRPSAEQSGLNLDDLGKRSMVLAMFLKDPDLLVAARYRSLTGVLQAARPFTTNEAFTKQKLTSVKFRSEFESRLKGLPEIGGKKLAVDRVETLKGDEAVTVFVKHEGDLKRVAEFDKVHWDSPLRWVVVTFYPKTRALEIRTRQRTLSDAIVRVAGICALNRDDAYRPVRSGEEVAGGDGVDPKSLGVRIERISLRSLEAEGVSLAGSPSVRVRGADVRETVKQLATDKDIDLTASVISWEVRVRYIHDGITDETTVSRGGRQTEVTFRPPPPYPVKRLIYRMIEEGKLPPLSR